MENVLAEMHTFDILRVVHSLSKTAHLEPFSLCAKCAQFYVHM